LNASAAIVQVVVRDSGYDSTMSVSPPSKLCVVCGRSITWRKKWARSWDEVRYCSDACRRQRRRPIDQQLEQAIQQLLAARPHDATICPSEAARLVSPDDWRKLMEPARQAARRLVITGEVQITQAGKVVNPDTAKGPIRIRLRQT